MSSHFSRRVRHTLKNNSEKSPTQHSSAHLYKYIMFPYKSCVWYNISKPICKFSFFIARTFSILKYRWIVAPFHSINVIYVVHDPFWL